MKRWQELTQWLGLLLLISAAILVVCLVFFPGNPAWMVAAGLTAAFLAAFAAMRLVLWLLRGRK